MCRTSSNDVANRSCSLKTLIALFAFCALCGTSQSRVDELLAAAAEGDVARIAMLLKQGVDVNARNERGQTPIPLALAAGHPEAARLLLNHKANVNLGDKSGETALMLAAKGGNAGIVNEPLNRGARINANNSLGMTMSDQVAVAGVLARKGATSMLRPQAAQAR